MNKRIETPFIIEEIERDSLSQNLYSIWKNNEKKTWILKFMFMYQNNYNNNFTIDKENFFVKDIEKYWWIKLHEDKKYILIEFPQSKKDFYNLPKIFLNFSKKSKRLKQFNYVLIIQSKIKRKNTILYLFFNINEKLLWDVKKDYILNINNLLSIIINSNDTNWNKNSSRHLFKKYFTPKIDANKLNFQVENNKIKIEYKKEIIKLIYNFLLLEYKISTDKWSDKNRKIVFKTNNNLESTSINLGLINNHKIKTKIRPKK